MVLYEANRHDYILLKYKEIKSDTIDIRYNIAWYESWTKHRLPLPRRYNVPCENREQCVRGWQRMAAEGMYKDMPVLEETIDMPILDKG